MRPGVFFYSGTLSVNAFLEHNFTNSISQQFMSWIIPLIISKWQLEPVVVMAAMQRDVWRGTQDTCAHLL